MPLLRRMRFCFWQTVAFLFVVDSRYLWEDEVWNAYESFMRDRGFHVKRKPYQDDLFH
jgi:hypothetical protein